MLWIDQRVSLVDDRDVKGIVRAAQTWFALATEIRVLAPRFNL